MSQVNRWRLGYASFILLCIWAYFSPGTTKNSLLGVLKYCYEHEIAWLICGIAFGGKAIKQLYFKEIPFKTSFIPSLMLFLEAATYAIVLKSSFTFLYAVVQQLIMNQELSNDDSVYLGESSFPFNKDYFGNFDYLTLSVAAFFLIGYSLFRIKDEITDSFMMLQASKVEAATREEFEKAQQNNMSDK